MSFLHDIDWNTRGIATLSDLSEYAEKPVFGISNWLRTQKSKAWDFLSNQPCVASKESAMWSRNYLLAIHLSRFLSAALPNFNYKKQKVIYDSLQILLKPVLRRLDGRKAFQSEYMRRFWNSFLKPN